MRRFLKVSWILLCAFCSLIFLVAACSQFIPPDVFSFTIFFSIAFPYLFATMLVLAVASFFINKKTGILLSVLLLLGLYNLAHTIAVTPGSNWQPVKEKN